MMRLRRAVWRVAHRYEWHHTRILGPLEPDHGFVRRCDWCGFSQGYRYDPRLPLPAPTEEPEHG